MINLRLLLSALLGAAVSWTVAAEPILQPGDTLALAVSGMPELGAEVVVDADGAARLPWIGALQAAGRPLSAVRAAAKEAADGVVIRRFDPQGATLFVGLSADNVDLRVAAFRPAYVSGDVGAPGVVAFRPGMTVRAAIAVAGGARLGRLTGDDDVSPREEARLIGDYAALSLQLAQSRAQIWRLEAELAEDPSPAPPPREDFPVDDAVQRSVMATQRSLLDVALRQLEADRRFLRDALAQIEDRDALLGQQADNQRAAVQFDDEEVERVSRLFDRGVVPIDRLVNIRRAQLDSSTRLLQTEDGLERLALDRLRFLRDIEGLEDDRDAAILEALSNERAAARAAAARLVSTSEQLAAIGLATPSDEASRPEVIATLHRDADNGAGARRAEMDELVMPGDVIDVAVLLPAINFDR